MFKTTPRKKYLDLKESVELNTKLITLINFEL